jgi:hypothetical protein
MIIGGRKDKVIEIHNSFSLKVESAAKMSAKIKLADDTLARTMLKKDPGGRRFAICTQINDTVCLIHGGETFDSHFREPVGDALLLDTTTLKWFNLGYTGVQLQNHTVCLIDGTHLIVHGGLGVKNKTNNITYEIKFH